MQLSSPWLKKLLKTFSFLRGQKGQCISVFDLKREVDYEF